MRRLLCSILIVMLTGGWGAPPATQPAAPPAQPAPPAHATPEQVEQAIKRAQEFLFTQDLSANAPVNGAMYESNIGQASLAAYALLVSGIGEKDPRLAPILKQLKVPTLRETY